MAQAFAAAREVFEEVDDALSQALSKLMWQGDEDELILTANAQPALMAVSLAVLRVLETELGVSLAGSVDFVAGHSLGEYSALCAARAFSLSDCARLLKARGRAMQQAVPVGEGAMAAILGLDLDAVRHVLAGIDEDETCQPANDNAPGQVVISGGKAAVEHAIDLARDAGARRAILLPVSAPFHCELMRPAAEAMVVTLGDIDISVPIVPLIANVTAGPLERPEEIRASLVDQVTAMVRWRESIEYMAEHGVTRIFELGAGKILSGLARRINRDIEVHALGTPEDIDAISGRIG